MHCLKCKNKLPNDAKFCNKCGVKTNKKNNKSKKIKYIPISIFILLILLLWSLDKSDSLDKYLDKELMKDDEYVAMDEEAQKEFREKGRGMLENVGITNEQFEKIDKQKEDTYNEYLKDMEGMDWYKDASEDEQKELRKELKSDINKEFSYDDILE